MNSKYKTIKNNFNNYKLNKKNIWKKGVKKMKKR